MPNLASRSVLLFLVACGSDPHENQNPDAQAAPDAPATASACAAGHELELHGAFEAVAPSAGVVTIDGKASGIAGGVGGDVATFTLREWHPGIDLETDRDVATVNLGYLRQPSTGSCDSQPCEGFYALSGTYHVIAVHPRYQATFMLGDLRARHTASDAPGDAVAGSVTGCIDVSFM